MPNQIVHNGPPAWVLNERRRQAAEQAMTQSAQTKAEREPDREHVTNTGHADSVTHSKSTVTGTQGPFRQPQKEASFVS